MHFQDQSTVHLLLLATSAIAGHFGRRYMQTTSAALLLRQAALGSFYTPTSTTVGIAGDAGAVACRTSAALLPPAALGFWVDC
jgi:hypothetical protein